MKIKKILIVLSILYFLLPILLVSQSRKIIFQGRTYLYSDGKYYIKSGSKRFHLVRDNVVVKLKGNLEFKNLPLTKYNLPKLDVIASIADGEYKLIKIPQGHDLLDVFIKLQNSDYFEMIEPNAYTEYFSIPNDYYYTNNYQWNLSKIEMPKAWDISTGSSNVIVAVIGAGVEYNHEDLINQLNNNYKGWNYATNSEDPFAYNYHETRCTGIIGASTNNSIGVSGIAGGWNGSGIKMMYFQCQPDQYSQPTSANIADAIYRARSNGAKVISMSLGGLPYSTYLNAQITSASNAGVVICIAAGNYLRYYKDKVGWVEEEAFVNYPASQPDVISVGATIESDYRKAWDPDPTVEDWGSCYIGHLDIVAPGIHIPTTDLESYIGNKYTLSFSGTSAATPHIAGVVALIFSIHPNSLSVAQVKTILENGCDFKSFMNSDEYGYGRINAYKALKYTLENYGGTLTQDLTIPSVKHGILLMVLL